MDISFYSFHFGGVDFDFFPVEFFESLRGYNRLLLGVDFYKLHLGSEFILILQTDAVILRDDLDFWCSQPYDYVGAPWPFGVEIELNRGRFIGAEARKVRAYVGNGGLSLRRTRKFVELLEDFEKEVDIYLETGFDNIDGCNEDVFFAAMAQVSSAFSTPDPVTASLFSTEYPPDFYLKYNGNRTPSGGHAWWKFDPDFWLGLMRGEPRSVP
jgi:hypothetical protein